MAHAERLFVHRCDVCGPDGVKSAVCTLWGVELRVHKVFFYCDQLIVINLVSLNSCEQQVAACRSGGRPGAGEAGEEERRPFSRQKKGKGGSGWSSGLERGGEGSPPRRGTHYALFLANIFNTIMIFNYNSFLWAARASGITISGGEG